MSENFIVDTMTWSFSRLTSYDSCPYGWKRKYEKCEDDESNYAAENGSAVHKTLEMYLKGEVGLWDLPMIYEDLYDQMVTHQAPYNRYTDIAVKTHFECQEYFNNLVELDNKYEILGVELEERFKLDKYEFIGYIDLLLRDKLTGEITVSDHKSHRFKFLKNGNISKTDLPDLEKYKKQLYLYSINIIQEYGRVDYLRWNLFRQQKELIIPFDNQEFEDAKMWALNTIHSIENDNRNDPISGTYYCYNLCGYRYNCPYCERKTKEEEWNPEDE